MIEVPLYCRVPTVGRFLHFRVRLLVRRVDFVDFDVLNRIAGVSPCHPQTRTGVSVLTQTCEVRRS